jgi:type III secretion protein J
MSSTLASIDGVVSARVHLVVPERNPLSDKPQPAAASVFIKHRPDKDFTRQVPQIKALVVNSIEGLPYDNVTVALFAAESLPLGAAAPEAKSAAPAQPAPVKAGVDLPLWGGAAGGVLLLAGSLLWWRRRGDGGRPASDESERPGHVDDATLPAPALRPVGNPAVRSREELQAALRRAAAAGQAK